MVLKGKGTGKRRLLVGLQVSSIVLIWFNVMLSLMMVGKLYQVLVVMQALETLAILRPGYHTKESRKRKQKRKNIPKTMDEL